MRYTEENIVEGFTFKVNPGSSTGYSCFNIMNGHCKLRYHDGVTEVFSNYSLKTILRELNSGEFIQVKMERRKKYYEIY